MVSSKVNVGNRKMGDGESVFFIAEIGINFDGKKDRAKKLIDVAADAGCDAAKFQLFSAEKMYVDEKSAGYYELMGKKIPIVKIVKDAELPVEWIPELMDYCKDRGIIFFSSVFDEGAADVMQQSDMELFKMASYELTHIPLFDHVASKKIPIIFSTGGGNMSDINDAAQTIRKHHNNFAIMQCIANYPATMENANLGAVETLKRAFECPVGFSDNGFRAKDGRIDDHVIPEFAAKAGADCFEIHITTNRKLPGPDHGFATEPDELKKMVKLMQGIRENYNTGKRFEIPPLLYGSTARNTYKVEEYVRNFCYRKIFAVKSIKEGEKIRNEDIAVLRPGECKAKEAIDPKYYWLILEKAHASKSIKAGSPLVWDSVL
ncbi:N-acetylneuraminate synthase family protein [Candidatus Micrarchaeota archaeon]|nr:N-acetylneuraminate synthase family protein [Candidatus Micrarchaeota archaeon]